MNKLFYLILTTFLMLSCGGNEKRYEDYDDKDFVEVQGIIIKVNKRYTFQNIIETDLFYVYNLQFDNPRSR